MADLKSTAKAALLFAALLFMTTPAPAEDASAKGDDFFLAHKLTLGYRAISTDDNPHRAAQYDSLDSGPVAAIDVRAGTAHNYALLDLGYISEKDYQGELDLNYKGALRFNLFSQSLFHNLDHFPNNPAVRPEPVTNTHIPMVAYADADPAREYGVQVEQNAARLRAKHPLYPAHLNVGYWRLERSGKQQLRYVREGEATGTACDTCHVNSRTRSVDRVTEEVTAGFDAHLGPVDLVYEFLNREFRDKNIPRDFFDTGIMGQRAAGVYQHDENPDSRLQSHTVKVHSSLAGGAVAAASYTIGQRENRSDLVDVQGVMSETDFQKATGDLTWIPLSKLTFNFRYRWLDLDNENSSTLTTTHLTPAAMNPLPVRENIDTTRGSAQATVSYRPIGKLTLKGEYQREEIHRGNTGDPVQWSLLPLFFGTLTIDPVWELPEEEVINRYRVGFQARPLDRGRLKVNGWYQIQTTDDPAYGISVEDGHAAFLGAQWMPAKRFGLTANLRADQTENTHRLVQFDSAAPPTTYSFDRQAENQNLTAGLWVNPVDAVTLSLNYGFLRTRIIQDLLFGNEPDQANVFDPDVEYSQRVQTATAAIQWQALKTLVARAEGRHIRSFSAFDPRFFDIFAFADLTGLTSVDSTTLRQLSQVEIRQLGATLGLEWTPAEKWNCGVTYTYDDYDDVDQNHFDGTAQTCMLTLARSW